MDIQVLNGYKEYSLVTPNNIIEREMLLESCRDEDALAQVMCSGITGIKEISNSGVAPWSANEFYQPANARSGSRLDSSLEADVSLERESTDMFSSHVV
jgi:hypothetical protein